MSTPASNPPHHPPKAEPVLHIDNERVRVTEWRFAPGAETGFHVHEMTYVIVPLDAGRMQLTAPDGMVSEAELVPGRSYFREKGVAHDVRNIGDAPFAFVEVELKPA